LGNKVYIEVLAYLDIMELHEYYEEPYERLVCGKYIPDERSRLMRFLFPRVCLVPYHRMHHVKALRWVRRWWA
jgi:hypothetical protein